MLVLAELQELVQELAERQAAGMPAAELAADKQAVAQDNLPAVTDPQVFCRGAEECLQRCR